MVTSKDDKLPAAPPADKRNSQPPAPVEPEPAPRDFVVVLRDIARVQASLAPQRQDVCGALWSELAASCDHELDK